MEIDRHKNQFVNQLLRQVIPDYNGNKISIEVSETVNFLGTLWSGGCRSVYHIVNLANNNNERIPNQPFLSRSPMHETDINLANGIAVVEYRQGQYEYVVITIHPSNVNNELIPATPNIPEDHKIVLEATRGLKSSYAGIKNYRFHTSNARTGITLDRWNKAKAELIALGHLNKAGAITITGRNLIPR